MEFLHVHYKNQKLQFVFSNHFPKQLGYFGPFTQLLSKHACASANLLTFQASSTFPFPNIQLSLLTKPIFC
jgi:hypothetical protein